MWQTLYSKVRADLAASIAGGGLTTVVLYLLDAGGIDTDAQTKAALAAGIAWIGGKIAAYLRRETGPVAGPSLAATPPGGQNL